MTTVVVLGEHPRVDGFALAGASLVVASSPEEVRRAWAALPDEAMVVLTPAAAAALDAVRVADPERQRITAVLPP